MQAAKLRLDRNRATIALHTGYAVCCRHQIRAAEVKFCGRAMMAIVDRFDRPAGHPYAKCGFPLPAAAVIVWAFI